MYQDKYNKCFGCPKRHIGCHTSCQDYKLFKQHLKEIKEDDTEIYTRKLTYEYCVSPAVKVRCMKCLCQNA